MNFTYKKERRVFDLKQSNNLKNQLTTYKKETSWLEGKKLTVKVQI